ncbi:proline-rich protein HaeIII subfamily 1-like [Episyrphus balteatus]|uniref:proline-rich protein HaeIII subfamily 1-like n=1 Tax=Episyrphus balteatus TaxID=286459 RepID=UPI002484D7F1|nr:proline-rich protein HaeIII subfamily 1-like [Episyrphus balteatus]
MAGKLTLTLALVVLMAVIVASQQPGGPGPRGPSPPPRGSSPPPRGSSPPPRGSSPPPRGSSLPPRGASPPPRGSQRPNGPKPNIPSTTAAPA